MPGSVTAQEVRQLWQSRVRALLGVDDYRVGPRWDKTFDETAERFNRLGLDARRYVDAQIEWAVHTNRPGTIWPNILKGDKALERYQQTPSEQETLSDLREYYLAQATVFGRVCDTVSEEVALTNRLTEHSPLFLCFVTWKSGRAVSPELVEDARRELDARPLARQIFDLMFVAFLEGR